LTLLWSITITLPSYLFNATQFLPRGEDIGKLCRENARLFIYSSYSTSRVLIFCSCEWR